MSLRPGGGGGGVGTNRPACVVTCHVLGGGLLGVLCLAMQALIVSLHRPACCCCCCCRCTRDESHDSIGPPTREQVRHTHASVWVVCLQPTPCSTHVCVWGRGGVGQPPPKCARHVPLGLHPASHGQPSATHQSRAVLTANDYLPPAPALPCCAMRRCAVCFVLPRVRCPSRCRPAAVRLRCQTPQSRCCAQHTWLTGPVLAACWGTLTSRV